MLASNGTDDPAAVSRALAALAQLTAVNARTRIYWGDAVPVAWNSRWPPELQTVPERTLFTRTTLSLQLLEFISSLKQKSENVHVRQSACRSAPASCTEPHLDAPSAHLKSHCTKRRLSRKIFLRSADFS